MESRLPQPARACSHAAGLNLSRWLIVGIGLLTALLGSCTGVEQEKLELGTPVEGTLVAGEAHSYRIALKAERYLSVFVEHRSIGVTLQMFDSSGEPLGEAAALSTGRSVQMVSLVSETAGDYRLEVRATGEENATGSLVVEIGELRPSTSLDAHRVTAERLYAEGYRLRLARNPESLRAAIEKYEQALASWHLAGDPAGQGRTLNAIGYAYRLLPDYPRAIEAFERTLPFWRQAGDSGGESDTLNNIGFVHRRQGNLESAIELYRRSQEKAGDDRRKAARALANLAAVYRELSEPEKALENYRQAVELYRAGSDPARAAKVLVSMASLYSDLQEQRKALDGYHEAIPLLRASGETEGLAAALNNLGESYSILGLNERAATYYLEALELSRLLGDRRFEGRTLNNLGLALHLSGEPRTALGHFENGVELLKADADHRAEAATLLNAARSYRAIDQSDKALEVAWRALEIKRSENDRGGEAVVLTEIASIYVERGRIEEALKHLEPALELSRAVKNPRTEAVALLEWARAARQLGDWTLALERIEAAIGIVEARRGKVGSHARKAAFLATKRSFYELWIDILMALHGRQPAAGFDARALQASERVRARSLVDMLEDAQVEVDRRAGPELQERERSLQRRVNGLELDRSRWARRPSGPEITDIEQQLETALAELEQTRSLIRRSSPAYASLTATSPPLTVAELRRQILDPDTVWLQFALGENRSFLWVVTPTSIRSFELPDRATIDAAARSVYELLTERERTPEGESPDQRSDRIEQADAAYPAAARALSRMLLGPVEEPLAAGRLLIVTEGSLSYVPFGGLVDPWRHAGESKTAAAETWRPLLQEYEIVRLPSASTLSVLRRDQALRPPAREPLIVLADPVFSRDDPRIPALRSQGHSDVESSDRSSVREYLSEIPLRRLAFTRAEAESAAAHVPGAKIVLGPEAAKDTVVGGELRRYRVIHFATHGILNNRHPELSALVLTLFDAQGQAVDGFLRLHDIYNLNLEADLVVLSACQTALGREIKGEGLVGLTRGFMYAGASRVLATLWTVQDRATMKLMSRFYQHMMRDGERPAAAIRQAQLSLRESPGFSAPYYWAGFELQGEWR